MGVLNADEDDENDTGKVCCTLIDSSATTGGAGAGAGEGFGSAGPAGMILKYGCTATKVLSAPSCMTLSAGRGISNRAPLPEARVMYSNSSGCGIAAGAGAGAGTATGIGAGEGLGARVRA